MGLRLNYNGYNFDTETTLTSIGRAFEHDDRGRKRYETQTWRIRTILQADGQTAITAAINALEAKLEDGHDLILYQTDGVQTPHKLLDALTLLGVFITGIEYSESTGSEYANKRVADISFTGIKSVSQTDNVISFSESVSFTGGGPRHAWQECIEGDPQKYQVAKKTLYYATQSGTMEALAITDVPDPLWGADVQDGNPDINMTPVYVNNQLRYRYTWTYRFISREEFSHAYNVWR